MSIKVLGIETSCDDTSVCILEFTKPYSLINISNPSDINILSHLSYSQEKMLKKWGGVVPELASRNHLATLTPLLKSAFEQAHIELKEINLIGVTHTPGLLGPLLTGINAAKTLSMIEHIPIAPINHLYAHIEAIHLTETIRYPYMGCIISGGHTLILNVLNAQKFDLIASTTDDAAGEAFDKIGKMMGLPYPAGRYIDTLATFGNEHAYNFPQNIKIAANSSNLISLSFSGIKNSARLFIEKNPDVISTIPTQFLEPESQSQPFYDLCASIQFSIIKHLGDKILEAYQNHRPLGLEDFPMVIGGGVACNTRLRKYLKEKIKEVFFVKPEFCTDNAAMIANLALRNLNFAIKFPDCLILDAKSRYIEKKIFLDPDK